MKKLALLLGVSILLSSCIFQKSTEIDISLIPVKSGEKWGYINKKGVYVINPQFDNVGFFRDGIAKVEYSDGKIGYIDEKGKQVIPAKYTQGTHFYEAKAFVVTRGGAPECIDKKGNVLFSLKDVKEVCGFSEGLAKVMVKNKNQESKYGYVDEKGNMVITPQFDAAESFSEGLAAVRQNGKWGYINQKGIMVISPQFEAAFDFKEGLARFYNGNNFGFIDKKGTYIITPQYGFGTGDFSEGLALIRQGDMYGYIDKKGAIVINPQFESANDFANKLARFSLNNKVGFIDKSSKQKIFAQFEQASDFIDGIAFVQLGDKWGLIDKNAKYLVSPQYDNTKQFAITANNSKVVSEYYDASKQVRELLNQLKISDSSFDGFNANTTLQDIINNPLWGDYANCFGDGISENDPKNCTVSILNKRALYKLKMGMEDVVAFPVCVCFRNPICSRTDYYSPKEFALEETISSVLYLILPLHNIDVEISVMKELEKQISQKNTALSFNSIFEGDYSYLDAAFSNKINIALCNADVNMILMLVGFDSYSQDLMKQWGDNLDGFYNEFFDEYIDL